MKDESRMQISTTMTRIRTHRFMFSRALFVLLLRCAFVVTASRDPDSLLHAFGEMKTQKVPSPRVRSLTRRLQDDKNNDKNNVATVATSAPTVVATKIPAPSMASSVRETPSPTIDKVVTSAPTLVPAKIPAPSMAPSVKEIPSQTPQQTPNSTTDNVFTSAPTLVPAKIPAPSMAPSVKEIPSQTPQQTPNSTTDNVFTSAPTLVPTKISAPSMAPSVKEIPNQTPQPTPNSTADNVVTSAPTLVPTKISAPSMEPSVKETPNPTLNPTTYPTLNPTTNPTSNPTVEETEVSPTSSPWPTPAPTFSLVENSVGNLVMEMSISEPTVSAADVNEGRANTLLNGVLAGMLEIQCRIHYIMVLDDSLDATRACPETFEQRALQAVGDGSKDDFPVVWTMSRVFAEDYQDEKGDTLMYWTVAFPVLDIGKEYTQWAVEKSNTTDEKVVNGTALEGMYEDSYYALQKYIQRGYMEKKLSSTATAVADPSNDDEEAAPAPGAYPSEQLDPHPLHPMRVAGMIVLVVTLVCTFVLVKLSARRKKERERDSAIAKINKGGLVTEEGLNLMLDVGRRASEKAGLTSTEIEVVLMPQGQQHEASDASTKENPLDSEEQSRRLPMPGYLNHSKSSSLQTGDATPDAKEGAVLKAAKDSTKDPATDVNKTYSFLSIFGSHDDDSETDEVILPDDPHGLEETLGQTIAGFVSMFSASSESRASSSVADYSNAPGSQANSPHRKSNSSKEDIEFTT